MTVQDDRKNLVSCLMWPLSRLKRCAEAFVIKHLLELLQFLGKAIFIQPLAYFFTTNKNTLTMIRKLYFSLILTKHFKVSLYLLFKKNLPEKNKFQ